MHPRQRSFNYFDARFYKNLTNCLVSLVLGLLTKCSCLLHKERLKVESQSLENFVTCSKVPQTVNHNKDLSPATKHQLVCLRRRPKAWLKN